MDLSIFLHAIQRTGTLPEKSTFVFFGKEYYFLFFSHFFSFLQKHAIGVQRINVVLNDSASIKAQLSMISFSGKIVFWLDGLHNLSAKKQQEWIVYLENYTGPHIIMSFISENIIKENNSSSVKIVLLPEIITAQNFSILRLLLNNQTYRDLFVSQIEKYCLQLSLDSACLLAHYEIVIGKNIDLFFKNWAVRIVEHNSSLFVLSQYFFAKKAHLFFKEWSSIIEHHPTTYWIALWSDQLWRAYCYVFLMRQKKYDEAKKNRYKLPFSFINKDWSLYSLDELCNAYQFLYTLDFHTKNGAVSVSLELFYCMFFENKFKNTMLIT